MSPEILVFIQQCVEGATFTVAAAEVDALAAKLSVARKELAEVIAEQDSSVSQLSSE